MPACCISVIVAKDSSYVRYSFPVANSKTRTFRSGNEKVANLWPDGEMVIDAAALFDFLISKRSVELFNVKTLSGFS